MKENYISSMEFVFLQYGYKMKSLREKGHTNSQIAKMLKIPKEAVKAYFQENS